MLKMLKKMKTRIRSTLMLILFAIICGFLGCAGNNSTDDESKTGNETKKTFVFHAYNYQCIILYNDDDSSVTMKQMDSDGNNWYSVTLPAEYINFYFANNDNPKDVTERFRFEMASGDEKWFKDGNWYDYKPADSSSSGNENNDFDNGSEDTDSDTENTGNNTNTSWSSNIYLEIMPFSYKTQEFYNESPVKLDSKTLKEFKEKLNANYKLSQIGTTKIYYSLHKALLNLENYQFPDNLKSINIITFTDGLDNASASAPLEEQNFEGENNAEKNKKYGEWIKEQIDSRYFYNNTLKPHCYSVAVKGKDVTDINSFRNSLSYITSDGEEPMIKDEIENIGDAFSDIANGLVVKKTFYDFNLEIPYTYGSVKMIFDGLTGGTSLNSKLYFEGTINKQYILNITTSNGLTPVQKTNIQGIPATDSDGDETGSYIFKLRLEFPNDIPDSETLFSKDNCKQYYNDTYSSSPSNPNSEYNAAGTYKPYKEEFSTVIYLLLDATNSLDEEGINAIRNAAINFVDKLAEKAQG